MNPAVNPHLVVSCMIGDIGYRDVESSAIVGAEVHHDSEGYPFNYQVHSAALEDSVSQDNHLAVQCSQFELSRAQTPKAVISLAGVNHMVLLGKDEGVYAVPAFNEPVYLGKTLEEVRETIFSLRNATKFKQRDNLA